MSVKSLTARMRGWRLLNQQLVAPQFSSAVDLVFHMGVLQAQDYRMVRWAVAMRTKNPSLRSFTKAYDSGKIIRLHLHRCTWQLMASADYPWMFPLCAPKAKGALNGWMHSNKIYLPDDEKSRVREVLVREASGKRTSTKESFAQALLAHDIQMTDQRLSYHIRTAELDGVLCSGNLHPSKATYSLVCETVPQSSYSRDESLALLARKYFQSHSPATLEDFSWWSGLGINECRRAIDMIASEIHSIRLAEREFFVLDSCRCRSPRAGSCLLVSPYDEYLIAYKSRDISLTPEFSHHAHNNSGIFYPVIVSDGVVCGNWKPSSKTLDYTLFDDNTVPPQPSLDSAWNEYLRFRK